MGRVQSLAAAAFGVAAVQHATWAKRPPLDVIELPVGFFPEGIALGEGSTVYVGSLLDGSIWKGDLDTGHGQLVFSDAAGPAFGLGYDQRSGYLYVAGGWAGTTRVYDTAKGRLELVTSIAMFGADVGGFVNDIILTETAAYLTDSIFAQVYSIPLDNGKPADGSDTVASTLILSAEFPRMEMTNNANGIEMMEDGKTLIVVHMAAGQLFSIDVETGEAALIDLGGVLVHGDGLVLRQNTLWVVENTVFGGDVMQVSEIVLSADLSCGTVVRTLTNELFDEPATAVRKGSSLWVVMFKYFVPPEDVATTSYEIVRIDRDGAVDDVCPEESYSYMYTFSW